MNERITKLAEQSNELLERIKRDYEAEKSNLEFDSYFAGYIACLRRFGTTNERK